MSEYITTHEELIKLHGAKVTCKIADIQIDDAQIYVVLDNVYVLQNESGWAHNCCGYKCELFISSPEHLYEKSDKGCTNIKVVKTADKVIKKLDERLDDLTPSVVLEATKTWDNFTKVWNALYHKAEKIKSVSTLEKFTRKVKELAE